jgi:hypothetical protein
MVQLTQGVSALAANELRRVAQRAHPHDAQLKADLAAAWVS